MESLSELNYQHLRKIRLWKANVNDEGLRSICNYAEKVNTIEYLDLMDNNITLLGCEFLSRVLLNRNNKIVKLKLDNNPLTTRGLANLVVGLRENCTIEKLSFKNCEIDAKGMKYIQ
jgi:Ran GTPase-activating protein (RanGAP) involved in mRNA processing and transport